MPGEDHRDREKSTQPKPSLHGPAGADLVLDGRRCLWVLQLPEELADEAHPFVQFRLGQVEVADEAADSFFRRRVVAFVDVTAAVQRFQENGDESLALASCRDSVGVSGKGWRSGWLGFRFAHQFVEDDGYGLAEVHRGVFGSGGDAEKEVAMAEVLVGEADLFRSKEQRGLAAGAEMLAEEGGAGFETLQGFAGCAAAAIGGADDKPAVGDGVGDAGVFFSRGQDGLGVNGGAGFAKGDVVRMHDAQVERAEIGHGTGGGSDVERVAAGDENDAEAIEFCGGKHGA